MSETNRPPTPARQHAQRDGYQCWYYGGWVSRATVHRGGQSVVVYEQQEPFVLPKGADAPFAVSQTEFEGPDLPRFSVTLDDPEHAVKRIEVVLWREGEDRNPETVREAPASDGDDDLLILENTPLTCPPFC
jgi:dipeptidyl aminopeptidase/acylaminoacyl peptidase